MQREVLDLSPLDTPLNIPVAVTVNDLMLFSTAVFLLFGCIADVGVEVVYEDSGFGSYGAGFGDVDDSDRAGVDEAVDVHPGASEVFGCLLWGEDCEESCIRLRHSMYQTASC